MSDMDILTLVGKKIKVIRTKKNMTQQELAMACSFEKASMSRIESGQTNATLKTLSKICNVLEVPMYEIFSES